MSELAKRDLSPPSGSEGSALKEPQLSGLYNLLGNEWLVVDEHYLEKEYKFKDFQSALDFTNEVGALAEEVDHHPEICLSWGVVKVTIWTHSVGGLSEADFIFAAKSDQFA